MREHQNDMYMYVYMSKSRQEWLCYDEISCADYSLRRVAKVGYNDHSRGAGQRKSILSELHFRLSRLK